MAIRRQTRTSSAERDGSDTGGSGSGCADVMSEPSWSEKQVAVLRKEALSGIIVNPLTTSTPAFWMDGLSISTAVVTFGQLAKAIKESIEKVGENKKNLADLQGQVEDTVQELERLAQGHRSNVPTGELLTALNNLTAQLKTVNTNCEALARTQATGLPGFVKSWFKREKIEAEIKQLKDNRKDCCAQFQLLSLTRVEGYAARTEGTTARTEGHAVRIQTTTARTEGHTIRIEATTARTEGHVARTETNTAQLISLVREEKIRQWFQALDMREKQRATHALRHNDTGSWFLEDTKFAKWKEQPGCLWLRGNSGTGKSVLSSIAIDHLFDYRPVKVANSHPATPNFGIAYFYFDFRDEQKQLVENMLRSIIMQLSEQSPTPYSVLDEHFNSCQGGKFPTYDNLLAMLDTIVSQFTGTYIVLDALDECNEHDRLVQFLATLRGWAKPVHLLVASQPRTIFVDSTAFEGASVVNLEPDITHADILRFVANELKLNSKLKHIEKVKDAAPKIVDKSNGMIRMAACLLQELARKKIDTNINKILAKLPNDLFGIYSRFLQSIDEDDFVYVAALLRWLAFSSRPVTLLELDDALAINLSEPDRWVFEPENRGRGDNVCGLLEGLVAVGPVSKSGSDSAGQDSEDQERLVTLAHSSVSDYIVSKQFSEEYKHDLREAPSHTVLVQSCVAYLLHFEHNPLNANTLPQYPLAPYAARFWSHHLLRCNDRGVLRHSTMHLLEQGSKQFAALNCVCDIDNSSPDPDWSRHAPSPLYLCSAIAYIEGVRLLLENGADVNAAGGEYGSALQGAALHGHMHIIRILLDHGADVNTAGKEYGSVLQGAAVNGNVDIVHVLLNRGANVNTVGGEYGSALQGAALNGHMDIVRVLLEKGADVNVVGKKYGSALQAAAWNDHLNIVHLLLNRGADVNTAGGIYGSALQTTALRGHLAVVNILLEHGANVNIASGICGGTLHNAAWNGNVDIVRILLEHGADVNAMGGYHGSALQAAAWDGYPDIVRLLLKHGANVNAAGGEDGCALNTASARGHMDIVCLLLKHGANVNAAGGEDGCALNTASARGHMDIVRMLLEKGADVNAAGGFYGSALQGAALEGRMDIVRILLERGADVNAAGGECGSALQAAAWNNHLNILHLLLEHGTDVNAEGGKYGSALQGAVSWGHMDIVRLLLEKGADVNAKGGEYGSALQIAALYGYADVVRVLLDHGADVNATGGEYGSALQCAAVTGNVDIVRILLEKSADVNAMGGKLGSALAAASAEGHEEIAQLLREHGAEPEPDENRK
ncbi:ankyrin repeat-containing domain protein [Mycena polygramma]|nr:ankyrin repeat-containing domain protein [Mycena polygramma]